MAGLHTRGKPYVARAENIRRYTDGRFSPQGLDEAPAPLEEAVPHPTSPLPRSNLPPRGEVALLLQRGCVRAPPRHHAPAVRRAAAIMPPSAAALPESKLVFQARSHAAHPQVR